ncbi:hypothetical protein EKO04_007674 [Ascochyta lentis]|uniref:Uncharacterized protein n=1 Tax=Ascochyta lentis TaxID=205686 RepID=A0A8H7J3S0_9PLEO|nr:hypothetical protein EKO04_007674 [Ascochyta lentis]
MDSARGGNSPSLGAGATGSGTAWGEAIVISSDTETTGSSADEAATASRDASELSLESTGSPEKRDPIATHASQTGSEYWTENDSAATSSTASQGSSPSSRGRGCTPRAMGRPLAAGRGLESRAGFGLSRGSASSRGRTPRFGPGRGPGFRGRGPGGTFLTPVYLSTGPHHFSGESTPGAPVFRTPVYFPTGPLNLTGESSASDAADGSEELQSVQLGTELNITSSFVGHN